MSKLVLMESAFKDLFKHSFSLLEGKLSTGKEIEVAIKTWYIENGRLMFVCNDKRIDHNSKIYGKFLVLPYDRDARFQINGVAEFLSREDVIKKMFTHNLIFRGLRFPRIFTMSNSSTVHYYTPLDPNDPQSPFIDTPNKLFNK